ncbi:MAG TPA: PA14 domain-containing protein, partial [Polyangiaceae bacterium]
MKRIGGWALLGFAALTAVDAGAASPSDAVRVAPGPEGAIGAWLLVGPFHTPTSALPAKSKTPEQLAADIDKPPVEIDETRIAPKLGDVWDGDTRAGTAANAAPAWTLASSGEGPIDVKGALKTKETDVIAYASGTLSVPHGGKYVVLLGTDDGVRLTIDDKTVLTRDEARPYRSDDDVVPVELTAGEHRVVLKLHQRDGAWSFRFRIVDESLASPSGAFLELPGTHPADATALARKMSSVSIDRGLRDDRYAPELTVKFPEGAPLDVPLHVRAKLTASSTTLFDQSVGDVPAHTGALTATLPEVSGDSLTTLERGAAKLTVDVAGRIVSPAFYPMKTVREAVAHADRALAGVSVDEAWLPASTRDTLEYLSSRLVTLVGKGDGDLSALIQEAKELDQAATDVDRKIDPYAARTGFVRRAYRSPLDGNLAEYGVYVPPSYKPGDRRK